METTLSLHSQRHVARGEWIRTVAVVLVIGVAILGATVLLDGADTPGVTTVTLAGDASGPRPLVGNPPPDFAATTVTGEAFRLADLRGRPVWLTFGASWCADCRAEAPDIQSTYERFAPAGLTVVSIWFDEDNEDVRAYAARLGLDFTMIADPTTTLASRYRTRALPTHLFIGPDATIRAIRVGGLPPREMDALAGSIIQ